MHSALNDAKTNPTSNNGLFIVDRMGRGALHLKLTPGWDAPKLDFALIHPTYSHDSMVKKLLNATPMCLKIFIPSTFSLSLNAHLKTLKLKNRYDNLDDHYFVFRGSSNGPMTGRFIVVDLQ
jgi:hypothetical protein